MKKGASRKPAPFSFDWVVVGALDRFAQDFLGTQIQLGRTQVILACQFTHADDEVLAEEFAGLGADVGAGGVVGVLQQSEESTLLEGDEVVVAELLDQPADARTVELALVDQPVLFLAEDVTDSTLRSVHVAGFVVVGTANSTGDVWIREHRTLALIEQLLGHEVEDLLIGELIDVAQAHLTGHDENSWVG